jgi:hypothetical protein
MTDIHNPIRPPPLPLRKVLEEVLRKVEPYIDTPITTPFNIPNLFERTSLNLLRTITPPIPGRPINDILNERRPRQIEAAPYDVSVPWNP